MYVCVCSVCLHVRMCVPASCMGIDYQGTYSVSLCETVHFFLSLACWVSDSCLRRCGLFVSSTMDRGAAIDASVCLGTWGWGEVSSLQG